MIEVRRAAARDRDGAGVRSMWSTFQRGSAAQPTLDVFGALQRLDEQRLDRGGRVRQSVEDSVSSLLYLREGSVEHYDDQGMSSLMLAGTFRATRRRSRGLASVCRSDGTHLFVLNVRSVPGTSSQVPQTGRFAVGARRGALRLVASADGAGGSLVLGRDARVFSALLDVGQHLVHELDSGRAAWLHVVDGEVAIDGGGLVAGDGAGFLETRSVGVTARVASEILLVEVERFAEPSRQ